MKYYLSLISLISITISCSKEKFPVTQASNVAVDSIFFTELSPTICVSYDSTNCIRSYYLDLNKDSINDFAIVATHNSIWENNSWHNGFDFFFACLDSNRVISPITIQQTPTTLITYLNANYPVTDTCSTWITQTGFFLRIWAGPTVDTQTDTSKFIGVSIKKNGEYFNGWIKYDWSSADTTCLIKSYAIRRSHSTSILTGEAN